MIETITVSSRGQIVIPDRIRNELGISEGTKLVLLEQDNCIILEKESKFLSKFNKSNMEKIGWLALAENSMKKVWDNKKDDETWKKYL